MEQDSDAASWPPLGDSAWLYRPLTAGKMLIQRAINPITNNHLTPAAFMRRPPHPTTGVFRDQRGLSVTLENGRSMDEVIEAVQGEFNDLRGVCRITAGQIRSVSGRRLNDGTVVTVEPIQDAPDHANLVSLPVVLEESPTTDAGRRATADAEFVGGVLASMAEIVWTKKPLED